MSHSDAALMAKDAELAEVSRQLDALRVEYRLEKSAHDRLAQACERERERAERAERELAEERHLATVRGEMLTACERERDAMDATIERLTAERMGAAMRAEAAERERDEARRMIRNLAARIDRDGGQRMDLDADLAETVTRLDGVVAQTYADMDEARAALELRPPISPAMAYDWILPRGGHAGALVEILRTHAAKAKVKP